MFTIQSKSFQSSKSLSCERQAHIVGFTFPHLNRDETSPRKIMCFSSSDAGELFHLRILRSAAFFILVTIAVFSMGWEACAQNSVSIGSDIVLATTSESTIPVTLNVESDLSLLALTILFDQSFLSTSAEKVVPVVERFVDGAENDIILTVDNEDGSISWSMPGLTGEAVIAGGAGPIFTIEFTITQPISSEGTSINFGPVTASDTSLNAVSLTAQNGVIQVAEDTDEDGLPDDWEVEHFGDLRFGANDDPDGDNVLNLEEFTGDSDPFAIELELNSGWNLISLGVKKNDSQLETIFGDKITGLAWLWDADIQRYIIAQEISPENGYWVYSKADLFDENAIKIELP